MAQTIPDGITLAGPAMIGITIKERTVEETPPSDSISGRKIDPPYLLDSATSYMVSSVDDPNYRESRNPLAVYRKTRPTNLAYPWFGVRDPSWLASNVASLEHLLYLALDPPLTAGKTYTVTLNFNSLGSKEFAFKWGTMRSDAVHATHIGFRPDDPSKLAFLSLWTGSGGSRSFSEGSPFYVCKGDSTVDCENTANQVFIGLVRAPFTKERGENYPLYSCPIPPNYSFTDVYPLDFSGWQNPPEGTYRVCVKDVGCFYPFQISTSLWQDLFLKSIRGLYFQRSGIAIGMPEDAYTRPADFRAMRPSLRLPGWSLLTVINGLRNKSLPEPLSITPGVDTMMRAIGNVR